jgi:hypothetical protein
MGHQHDQKTKQNRRSRQAAKKGAEIKEIMSIEQFRAKYLPSDEKRRAAHDMTPEEIGEEFARTSLTAAKQVLSERRPSPATHRRSAAV